jgi:hypothetical protein
MESAIRFTKYFLLPFDFLKFSCTSLMPVKKPPQPKKKMNGLSRYEKLMYHLCMYIFIMFLCVLYMNVCACSVVLLIRLLVFMFENF